MCRRRAGWAFGLAVLMGCSTPPPPVVEPEPEPPAPEAAQESDTCGDGPACGSGHECVQYFAVSDEPAPPLETCERPCSYAGSECAGGFYCAMESAGPGFVCRPRAELAPGAHDQSANLQLAQVWSAVRIAHPRIGSRLAQWDEALLDALARNRERRSSAFDPQIVADMLDTLGDPATRLLSPRNPELPKAAPPRTEGDVLVVEVVGPELFDPAVRLAITKPLKETTRVVFDLRKVPDGAFSMLEYGFAELHPFLVSEPVELPTVGRRVFHGYPSQASTTSGGYYESFETKAPSAIVPVREAEPLQVVFVVGVAQVLPPIALPLVESGHARIVATVPLDERVMAPTTITTSGGRAIQVRSGELLYRGGRPTLKADAVTAADPLRKALTLVRRPARARTLPIERLDLGAPAHPRPEPPTDLPDLDHRRLAAIHMWSVLDEFHAYPDLRPHWSHALARALVEMEGVRDWDAYVEVLLRLGAATGDGHTRLSGKRVDHRLGEAAPPFRPQFVEGCLTVTEILEPKRAGELRVGDVISSIDGVPVTTAYDALAPLIAASTPDAHRGRIGWAMLRGPSDAPLRLTVQRDGAPQPVKVTIERWPEPEFPRPPSVYRTVADGRIGIVDLAHLERGEVDDMFEAFGRTEAIVFDMRGYPKGTAWSIAPYLDQHPRPTPAAAFDQPLVSGAATSPFAVRRNRRHTHFVQYLPERNVPKYGGRTVMLIDHRTISQAEHTGLFFRAANGTQFVGSPTAGANGDVTTHILPDGLVVRFTGQAVVPLEGPPLQRVGLQPDTPVRPTIAGVRAGRDEVLEAALAALEG